MTKVAARLQLTENFKNIQKYTLDLPAHIKFYFSVWKRKKSL